MHRSLTSLPLLLVALLTLGLPVAARAERVLILEMEGDKDGRLRGQMEAAGQRTSGLACPAL